MSASDYIVRELKVGDRTEAELLADMWNRSEEGWPGGWTGGVPYTAERVLHDFMTWHHFGAWLVACRSVAEAHAYLFLSDLKELP